MAPPSDSSGEMRINRAVAATGLCSRRAADRLIAAGRVRINGRVVTDFNCLVDPDSDEIEVDGTVLSLREKTYLALHKPSGVITSCADEKGRKTVLDLLPPSLRHLKPVGRLDRDSEGLLILTNDGNLASKLMHPASHVWKRYQVEVSGRISGRALEQLARGVELSEGKTLPAQVTKISSSKEASILEISIREGRNRQIRRMCSQLGYPVRRLVRVAIGRLQLNPIGPGRWQSLTREEIEQACLEPES